MADDPAPVVTINFHVGEVDASSLVEAVRAKVAAAEQAQHEAARANRDAARQLRAAGVSGNDIAGLLPTVALRLVVVVGIPRQGAEEVEQFALSPTRN